MLSYQSALKERLDEAIECGCNECKALLALMDEVEQSRRVVQSAREIVTVAREARCDKFPRNYANAIRNLMNEIDALRSEAS